MIFNALCYMNKKRKLFILIIVKIVYFLAPVFPFPILIHIFYKYTHLSMFNLLLHILINS